tara:strand:- start:161 stop:607 length:447 start_codon:yes stop_codon:yes gene_type:complete
MTDLIIGEEVWNKLKDQDFGQYGSLTVIICTLSNGVKIYCRHDKSVKDIKKFCLENHLYIDKVSVRFRSHEVSIDTKDAEGIYIVKAAKGSLASDTTYCIVLGKLIDGIVHKKAFSTPDLIELYSDEDPIEECFEEAMIYNEQKTNQA